MDQTEDKNFKVYEPGTLGTDAWGVDLGDAAMSGPHRRKALLKSFEVAFGFIEAQILSLGFGRVINGSISNEIAYISGSMWDQQKTEYDKIEFINIMLNGRFYRFGQPNFAFFDDEEAAQQFSEKMKIEHMIDLLKNGSKERVGPFVT